MTASVHRFVGAHLEQPTVVRLLTGEVAVFAQGYQPDENEDAALVMPLGEAQILLAVADGAGGLPQGGSASRVAIEALAQAAEEGRAAESSLRESILNGFDRANRAIRELAGGAASTVVVAALDGRRLRTYHAGDAGGLVVGQRGKLKLVTTAHSPVGYALEAGVLSEEDAIQHADRHIVSNLLGSADMRIEIGPELTLAARDTVVLGSDGLFDNLRLEEIGDLVRVGPLAEAATRLAQAALARMAEGEGEHPSKPDDLSFLVYRPSGACGTTPEDS